MKHTYATDTRTRTQLLAYLALAALVVTTAGVPLVESLRSEPSVPPALQPVLAVLPVVTMTGSFFLVYLVYRKTMWRIFTAIPDLSGTWVGFSFPNYSSEPRLEVARVEQDGVEITFQTRVYKKPDFGDWSASNQVGSTESNCASLGDLSTKSSRVRILAEHERRDQQGRFYVAFFLRFDELKDSLDGQYFTDRVGGSELGDSDGRVREGSQGPIILRRVSALQQDDSKALAAARANGRLANTEQEIRARRFRPHP